MIDRRPAAEIYIDVALVQALLAEQHPDLADLTPIKVGSGWDNAVYRLGDRLAVRLPRRAAAAALIKHEQRWLPALAARLPLPVPSPVRIGYPGCDYPWNWSVTPWLNGETAAVTRPHDLDRAAIDLAAFLHALHQPAPRIAPRNDVRGVPLADRSTVVHARIRQLGPIVDGAGLLALWSRLVITPPWNGPPLWLHGDLHPGNMLVAGGRVSAVIDFGDLCAGDPATDLSVAWMLFPPAARSVFRASARDVDNAIDDNTWTRARGWALALGLAFLANSRDDDVVAALGLDTLKAVLGEP